MTGTIRVLIIHGSIHATDPMVGEAVVGIEEFPPATNYTGFRVWTALSFEDKRLVVLAFPHEADRAIERWKSLRTDVRVDPTKFGLLLKGRHVPN